jgi:putative chitobiose transport system substrate-binding protein
MVFTGPVFLRRVKDNAPSIYKSTDVASAVVGKTGKHELAAMSISVMNSSIHKKEAVDFAFYVTNSENQIAFSKIETTYPSTIVALNDPFFTLDDGTLETKARIIGAKELFDAVRLRKYLEHPQFDKLRDAFDEAVQKACLGNATTKEALDEAAQKWNTILQGE